MSPRVRSTISRLWRALADDTGQDIVEYLLLTMLVAFAATAGMKKVSAAINTSFGNINTRVVALATVKGGGGGGGGDNGGDDKGGGDKGGGDKGGGDKGGGGKGGGGKGGD